VLALPTPAFLSALCPIAVEAAPAFNVRAASKPKAVFCEPEVLL
jgi:hypothetical protein